MTDKELQKLKRPELLEIMLNLKSELDKEKEENKNLEKKLEEKNISLEKSGSIAEAALKLNGVFGAAQEAADVYLNNIQKMHNDQEIIYNNTISEAKNKAAGIVAIAQKEANELKEKTEAECLNKIQTTDYECHKKVSDTNNLCLAKIRETQEKCTAISSLDSHIASFFNEGKAKELTPQPAEDPV